jgi:hypothetical protein
MPPLWQYFSRRRQASQIRPFRPPKGVNHGPPQSFPLLIAPFWGATRGDHDPPFWTPESAAAQLEA